MEKLGGPPQGHHVRFRGIEAFEHAPPLGGIVEVRRLGAADAPKPTLILSIRSDFHLATQITASGATWLDHRLVEREAMPLAMGGFGSEVREAMATRAEHLITERLAQRQNQRVIFQRDLLATLRQREPDAVGTKLAAETGLDTRKSAPRRLASSPNHASSKYFFVCVLQPSPNDRRLLNGAVSSFSWITGFHLWSRPCPRPRSSGARSPPSF